MLVCMVSFCGALESAKTRSRETIANLQLKREHIHRFAEVSVSRMHYASLTSTFSGQELKCKQKAQCANTEGKKFILVVVKEGVEGVKG